MKAKITEVIKAVELMANVAIENEMYFCELDGAAGDGDFGASLAKGFKQIKAQWLQLSREDIGAFLKSCAMIITEYCGGASGPIWGTAFRSMGKYAQSKDELDATDIAELLFQAVLGIQKVGGAKAGDKTLLDALIPAAEAVKANAASGLPTALARGAEAAVKGAEKTGEIIATKGRASYVKERSIGHPDAGAMAVGLMFQEIVNRF